MIVRLGTLRAAATALIDHLESCGVTAVPIEEDYYWDVPAPTRYDPYVQPTELTLGQLADDILNIEAVAQGSKSPIVYDLVWLAAILRKCGETTMDRMIRSDHETR